MRSTRSIEIPGTWHTLCDDTVGSVRCGHEGYRQSVRRYCSLTFTHAKKDLSNNRAPTQEQSKQQRVSHILEIWRGTTSEKLILTKSHVAPELIMCRSADHSQPRGGAEISWSSRQKLGDTAAEVCLVSSVFLLSAFSLSVVPEHVHL